MQDIKNKQGDILGTYELKEVTKPDTYEVDYTDKDGNALTKVIEVDKSAYVKLATQAFNTNMRNFVAGLAREKQDTKIALLKAYIRSKGLNVDLPTDELKKELGIE
jgi:hypothetical protein